MGHELAGEDCLNLNVWTPDPGSAGLPVMVWIQGGAFEIGSTAAYDGRNFARDGVVCVVINWRVGADGFLDLGDGQANVGLLDQVAALEWVRGNIAAFGGDPGNVTVFGQSAGAMSIGVLLSMPRAEGLFRRAILQSGAAHHAIPTETAQRIGGFLAEKLGVPPTREAMAAVPPQRFLAAQAELKADLFAGPDPARWGQEVVSSSMLWQPTIDGDVIPRRPIERIAAGAGSTVDVMVGTNTEDWKLFLAITGVIAQGHGAGPGGIEERGRLPAHGGIRASRRDGIPRVPHPLSGQFSRRRARRRGNRLVGADSGTQPGRCPRDVGDFSAYVHVRVRLASARPRRSPCRGSAVRLRHPGHDSRLFGPLLGTDPPQELADAMHAAWVSFAATGDPGWPGYDLERRTTMLFNTDSRVVYDPRAWERELWEGIR